MLRSVCYAPITASAASVMLGIMQRPMAGEGAVFASIRKFFTANGPQPERSHPTEAACHLREMESELN